MNSSTLTAYIDFGSQPSRAVFVYLKLSKIPFTLKEMSLMNLDHRSPEYRKINPNMKVPAITHGGLSLFESHAILRYLHAVSPDQVALDHWYPKDPAKRAKVDEYLDWHHSNLRQGAEGFMLA